MFSFQAIKSSGVLSRAAIFFAGVIFAAICFRSCEGTKSTTYSKAQVDSLRLADSLRYKFQYQAKMDSADIDAQRRDEIIKAKDLEIAAAVQDLRETSAEANKWHYMYKAAKEARDTVTMIVACDSVIYQFEEYQAATEAMINDFNYRDSVRDEKINDLYFRLELDQKQIKADSILKKQLFAEIDKHIKKDKVQERQIKNRKFWRWFERIGIAAGSIYLTSKVK